MKIRLGRSGLISEQSKTKVTSFILYSVNWKYLPSEAWEYAPHRTQAIWYTNYTKTMWLQRKILINCRDVHIGDYLGNNRLSKTFCVHLKTYHIDF